MIFDNYFTIYHNPIIGLPIRVFSLDNKNYLSPPKTICFYFIFDDEDYLIPTDFIFLGTIEGKNLKIGTSQDTGFNHLKPFVIPNNDYRGCVKVYKNSQNRVLLVLENRIKTEAIKRNEQQIVEGDFFGTPTF